MPARAPAPPVAATFDPPPAPGRRDAMRRNAVFSLFALADLGPPPALVWRFIVDDDVGRGVRNFLRATGADHEQIRLDALLRAETGLRAAAAEARSAWLADLLSGDATRFTAAATAAREHATPGLADHWPADLIPRDVDAGVAADLVVALFAHAELRETLLATWPAAWTHDERGSDAAGQIAAFEGAEVAALAALIAGSPVRAALAAMATANQALAGFTAGAGTGAAVGPLDLSAIDSAISLSDALDRWRALRLLHHPDRPRIDRAEQVERRRRCAAIDRALARKERLLDAGTT